MHYNKNMMNDDYIDYERENRISQEYYQKGYFDGSNKAQSDLMNYLINLPDEKLLEWKKKTIEMKSFVDALFKWTE